MVDLLSLVSELVRVDPNGPPVLTLYLDTHWRDQHQRERVRLFFNDRAREARQLFAELPEREEVEEALGQAGRWIERLVNRDAWEQAHGALLVCSPARGLFVEAVLPVSFEPAMYLDTRPRVDALAEAISFMQPALVASVDSHGAQILEWVFGAVVDEQRVVREVPQRHKMGGWSQLKYQKHVREHISTVWKECASLLERLAQEAPRAVIVLFGQDINVQNFRKLLPGWCDARVVATLPTPPDRNKLLEAARKAVDDEFVAREFALVHRLLRQGLSDRSGALGLDDVLEAVNERRVRQLALSRRFQARGWNCTHCDALMLSGSDRCPYCGEATRACALREELVRRCVVDGAELLPVRDGGPLDAYRGIGALLRHLSGEERQRLHEARGRAQQPEAPAP